MSVPAYCYSLGSDLEQEGHDRSDIELPGFQVQMLKDAMSSSNSGRKLCVYKWQMYIRSLSVSFTHAARVVVVLYNAGPLNVSMLKADYRVTAILESFFPAQVNCYTYKCMLILCKTVSTCEFIL